MTAGVEEVETVWIPLPDGTRLAAKLWLPEGARERPTPAVLEFLPYRRRDMTAPRDAATYPALARAGFAGVRVDLRGSGDSEGVWDDEYSETELSDAEAAIGWIAAQPWCSGSVGMMGISWGGFNALQVAARRPPALKAVISIASSVDRFADDVHYRGGCHLSAQLYWATTMLAYMARPPDAAVVGEGWRETWLSRLEALEAPILPWLSHQRRDAFWRHGSVCEDFAAVEAPALVIAGWADGYRNTPWKAMAGLGPQARAVTGPWIHKYPHFAWPRPRADFLGEAARWFGRWLGGEATGAEALPRHRLWVAENVRPGARREDEQGRWVALDPFAPARTRRLHLNAGGRLEPEAGPAEELAIRSPLDLGAAGGEFFALNPESDLPGDQSEDDARSACFETPPLEAALEVIGRPVLRLRVALDRPVGVLAARLVDVRPDGAAHRVALGLLNLAHRDGSERPRPMPPGEPETVEIALDACAYRFRAGHRLRLALSTAYFPMVLPPPAAATATIATGEGAWLDLPAPEVEVLEVPPPTGPDPLPGWAAGEGAADARRILRDADGEGVSVEIEADTGEVEHPENEMRWRETRRSDWAVRADDPLSLRGEERVTALRRRDGVTTEATATGALTATATHWRVEASVEAREEGRIVFSRAWRRDIPRDHM